MDTAEFAAKMGLSPYKGSAKGTGTFFGRHACAENSARRAEKRASPPPVNGHPTSTGSPAFESRRTGSRRNPRPDRPKWLDRRAVASAFGNLDRLAVGNLGARLDFALRALAGWRLLARHEYADLENVGAGHRHSPRHAELAIAQGNARDVRRLRARLGGRDDAAGGALHALAGDGLKSQRGQKLSPPQPATSKPTRPPHRPLPRNRRRITFLLTRRIPFVPSHVASFGPLPTRNRAPRQSKGHPPRISPGQARFRIPKSTQKTAERHRVAVPPVAEVVGSIVFLKNPVELHKADPPTGSRGLSGCPRPPALAAARPASRCSGRVRACRAPIRRRGIPSANAVPYLGESFQARSLPCGEARTLLDSAGIAL